MFSGIPVENILQTRNTQTVIITQTERNFITLPSRLITTQALDIFFPFVYNKYVKINYLYNYITFLQIIQVFAGTLIKGDVYEAV